MNGLHTFCAKVTLALHFDKPKAAPEYLETQDLLPARFAADAVYTKLDQVNKELRFMQLRYRALMAQQVRFVASFTPAYVRRSFIQPSCCCSCDQSIVRAAISRCVRSFSCVRCVRSVDFRSLVGSLIWRTLDVFCSPLLCVFVQKQTLKISTRFGVLEGLAVVAVAIVQVLYIRHIVSSSQPLLGTRRRG